jgi:hypothetical protein
MAQVVIFAPPGEDVSAGEAALKEAGHEVEVVEASPESLLHMAIGMLEGNEEEKEEAPEEEPTEAAAEEDPLDEPEGDEEVTKEAITVDDEQVSVSIDHSAKFSLLRAVSVTGGDGISYSINETRFKTWAATGETPVAVAHKGVVATVKVSIVEGKKPGLILCKADARRLGLV